MDDSDKTKPRLLNELALLRQQVKGLQDPDPTRARREGAPPAAWLDGESIMAAVREPLIVLDGDFRILAANRAFYQTFRVTAEEMEHQLLYDLGNRQWDIPALRHLLEDVLPASTAVKFTEQGSIVVEAHGQQDGIAISVSDTGIGIPPAEMRNIFEPFLQVERSTTQRYGGIGLGLHIVKRLLEMLGGTIEVQSTVGHGSTFRVWLPSDGNSPPA